MTAVLSAEWQKLRSLRSTTGALLGLVALTVGISMFFAAVGHTDATRPGQGDDDVVLNALRGVFAGQLIAAAFGVAAGTTEYATGLIRITFAATPRRLDVLAAKTILTLAAVGAAGLLASVVAFSAAQPLLHASGFVPPAYPLVNLADEQALGAIAGAAAYLAVLAAFGLGVGVIARRTAPAISLVFALVLVPLVAGGFLPGRAGEVIARLLPSAGLAALATTRSAGAPPLAPTAGFAVSAAWAAAALTGAGWLLARRDA